MHLTAGPWLLPFHLGVTVTQHQHPHSDQCWSGKGAGVHEWNGSGGDIAERQLETLWNTAQKPEKGRGKKRWRESEPCQVTFSALRLSKSFLIEA